MTLSIIAAMTDERVIGKDNRLPWHLSEDLIRFKQLTLGHALIMGRKTFDSIGKALPGRRNIVVTGDRSWAAAGTEKANSLDEAIAKAAGDSEMFVIGGASLFEQALPKADKLYLTLIHHSIPGDVLFPAFELRRDFDIVERTEHQSQKGDMLKFSFVTARRHGYSGPR